MTSCGEWVDLLSARLDEALAAPDRERADDHLGECSECQQRLRSLRALKHAIARLPSRETPPGAVRAHVESLVLRGRGAARYALPLRLGLAASFIVGAWAFVSFRHDRRSPSAELADALAGDHLHSVPEAMPAEVVTGDPREAIRFFSGRLPFTPVVPSLEGAHLIGGRLCKVQGQRVQLLFYRADSNVTLSLFVSGQALGDDGCREARGLQVCGRRADGLTLLIVGSSPSDHLRRLLDSAAF